MAEATDVTATLATPASVDLEVGVERDRVVRLEGVFSGADGAAELMTEAKKRKHNAIVNNKNGMRETNTGESRNKKRTLFYLGFDDWHADRARASTPVVAFEVAAAWMFVTN